MNQTNLTRSICFSAILFIIALLGICGCSPASLDDQSEWILARTVVTKDGLETYESATLEWDEETRTGVLTSYYDDGEVESFVTTSYDKAGRPLSYELEYPDDGMPYVYEEYTYNSAGQISGIERYGFDDGGNKYYGGSTAVEYEGSREVRRVTYDADGNQTYEILKIYDADGNVIEETSYDADGNVDEQISRSFDDKGRLTELCENSRRTVYGYSEDGLSGLETHYDEDGNIGDVYNLKYDEGGNVVGMQQQGYGAEHWEYAYNADGEMVESHHVEQYRSFNHSFRQFDENQNLLVKRSLNCRLSEYGDAEYSQTVECYEYLNVKTGETIAAKDPIEVYNEPIEKANVSFEGFGQGSWVYQDGESQIFFSSLQNDWILSYITPETNGILQGVYSKGDSLVDGYSVSDYISAEKPLVVTAENGLIRVKGYLTPETGEVDFVLSPDISSNYYFGFNSSVTPVNEISGSFVSPYYILNMPKELESIMTYDYSAKVSSMADPENGPWVGPSLTCYKDGSEMAEFSVLMYKTEESSPFEGSPQGDFVSMKLGSAGENGEWDVWLCVPNGGDSDEMSPEGKAQEYSQYITLEYNPDESSWSPGVTMAQE